MSDYLDIVQDYLVDNIDNRSLFTNLLFHMSDEERKKWLEKLILVYDVTEEDLYNYYVSISQTK